MYPRKISENQRFSDVFMGCGKEHWEEMGYTHLVNMSPILSSFPSENK